MLYLFYFLDSLALFILAFFTFLISEFTDFFLDALDNQ